MTDARAITCQLVDIRNVGAHKCVKLTIHVPEEQALRVTQLFGWPTGAQPVPVALARLTERKEGEAAASIDKSTDTPPRLESNASAGAERGHKSPAQIAGYLCTLPAFHRFLREKWPASWAKANLLEGHDPQRMAAALVRELCGVMSRAEITDQNTEWHALQLAFRLWQNHPELEDA